MLIDPEVLDTLPDRQVANGLAEAVKMALCFDEEGFRALTKTRPARIACSAPVRERLVPVLEKLGLPTACGADPDRVMAAAAHDKKAAGTRILAVTVEEAGSCRIAPMAPEELRERFVRTFGPAGKQAE